LPAVRIKTIPRKPAEAPAAAAEVPATPRKKAAAAGPAKKKAVKSAAPVAPPSEIEKLNALQALIVTSLEDDKAEEIVTIDLWGRTSFADRMVIATGLADRQISAMATHLDQKLSEAGYRNIQIEGAGSEWVLIDAGDVIVHLFKPEARAMYGLEKMWAPELDE
jgi:ribosome-associated protein